jgi:hypothetical protein
MGYRIKQFQLQNIVMIAVSAFVSEEPHPAYEVGTS